MVKKNQQPVCKTDTMKHNLSLLHLMKYFNCLSIQSKMVALFSVMILLQILTRPAVSGNDTFLYDNGSAVYPVNTDKVNMVWEEIKVRLEGDRKRYAHVDCLFEFENISSETVVATLGFPTDVEYSYYNTEDENAAPFEFFSVYINDNLTKSEYRDSFYIWEVTFPPLKKIRIRNTYKSPLSFSYYNQWFEYIMTTGANWKGPIQRASVTIEYIDKEDLDRRVIEAWPEGFRINDNKIIWELRNFVPGNDIRVTEINPEESHKYITSEIRFLISEYLNTRNYEGNSKIYTEETLKLKNNPILLEFFNYSKKNFSGNIYSEQEYENKIIGYYAMILRNEIYARHGMKFTNNFFIDMFNNYIYWYKVNPEYTEELLNEYEKRNIQFLSDYEKKRGWSQESMQ